MSVCVSVCVLMPPLLHLRPSLLPLSSRTPLHAAAFTGHVECVQLLLSHDVPVDDVDQSGRTALMMAAEKGKVGVLGTDTFSLLADSL